MKVLLSERSLRRTCDDLGWLKALGFDVVEPQGCDLAKTPERMVERGRVSVLGNRVQPATTDLHGGFPLRSRYFKRTARKRANNSDGRPSTGRPPPGSALRRVFEPSS